MYDGDGDYRIELNARNTALKRPENDLVPSLPP